MRDGTPSEGVRDIKAWLVNFPLSDMIYPEGSKGGFRKRGFSNLR